MRAVQVGRTPYSELSPGPRYWEAQPWRPSLGQKLCLLKCMTCRDQEKATPRGATVTGRLF